MLNLYPNRKYYDLDIQVQRYARYLIDQCLIYIQIKNIMVWIIKVKKKRKLSNRSVLNIYPIRKYYDLDIQGFKDTQDI